MTPPTEPLSARRRTRLNAADRRASIVAAAVEVFAETGYARAKMSEVARRVGVSEPVVFQNFGTKSALFVAVVDDAAERAAAAMREWATHFPSVAAWLGELLAPDHLARVHASGNLGVLFSDAAAASDDAAVEAASRRAVRTIAAVFADLLAQGHEDGSVPADVDPDTGAWWLLSLLASQGFRTTSGANIEASLATMTLRALTRASG